VAETAGHGQTQHSSLAGLKEFFSFRKQSIIDESVAETTIAASPFVARATKYNKVSFLSGTIRT
jgi:hypothetical protein